MLKWETFKIYLNNGDWKFGLSVESCKNIPDIPPK